jgi:hypothetical protein
VVVDQAGDEVGADGGEGEERLVGRTEVGFEEAGLRGRGEGFGSCLDLVNGDGVLFGCGAGRAVEARVGDFGDTDGA